MNTIRHYASILLAFAIGLGACTKPANPSIPETLPPEVIPATMPEAQPEIDPVEALTKFASLPRPVARLAATPFVAQPMQVLSDGQLEVAVEGHYGAQKTPDGGWVVHVPTTGARVTSVRSLKGPAYWGLNIPGPNDATLVGKTITAPFTVTPCDALWTVSGSAGGQDRPDARFNKEGAVPALDEAMCVVFVPYEVRESVTGKLLRPPAWGRRNALTEFLRSFPFPIAWIDWSRLPSVIDFDDLYRIPGQPRPDDADRIDPNEWGAARPNFQNYLTWHEHCPADFYSGWGPHFPPNAVPFTAHQQYGTFYMGMEGVLHLFALSTAPIEQRKLAVFAILQRAIDNLGGLCDSSDRYALGGHCWGRRAGLVWLGHFFHPIFGNPSPIVGKRLPEDKLVRVVPYWKQGTIGAMPDWTGYVYSHTMDQQIWTRHPSTWGDSNVQGSEAWCQRYGGQVVPAMVAQVVGIILLGEEAMAPEMCHMVRCWMQGPPPEVEQDLLGRVINFNFRKDYVVPAKLATTAFKKKVA